MESRDDQRRGGGNPAPATTYIILSRSGAGYLGSYLFSTIPTAAIETVYPSDRLIGVRKISLLPGYVSTLDLAKDVPDYGKRPIDIGYRGRELPFWLGHAGQEKRWIADRFCSEAPSHEIVIDVSCRELDRFIGAQWERFVTNCKSMLGTEGGTEIIDRNGKLEAAVETYLHENPDTPFQHIYANFLAPYEGQVNNRKITPRIFDAATLRTLMINYEGAYSHILEPGRHYVALRKDHSNMEEVFAVVRDPMSAQRIIDRAYREVACNPAMHFSAMVDRVDGVIDDLFVPARNAAQRPLETESVSRAVGRAHRIARQRLLFANIARFCVRVVSATLQVLPRRQYQRSIVPLRLAWHWIGRRFGLT